MKRLPWKQLLLAVNIFYMVFMFVKGSSICLLNAIAIGFLLNSD